MLEIIAGMYRIGIVKEHEPTESSNVAKCKFILSASQGIKKSTIIIQVK